jgi:hypothetical protein
MSNSQEDWQFYQEGLGTLKIFILICWLIKTLVGTVSLNFFTKEVQVKEVVVTPSKKEHSKVLEIGIESNS